MRVLIVDDEPLVRTALERILTARSDVERFDSAADAIEAEERLTNNRYDVMLLDISLPARTGLELLDRMRQFEKPAPSVVLVTAYAQHALTAFEKHAVDYILKPFSPERVNQALEFASRRTESERAARLLEVMPHLRTTTDERMSKIAIRSSGRILFIDPQNVAVIRPRAKMYCFSRIRVRIAEAIHFDGCGQIPSLWVRSNSPFGAGQRLIRRRNPTSFDWRV